MADFRDVSEESGIANFPGKGLGVAMNDYDRDGWPDIVVANDSFPSNCSIIFRTANSKRWRSQPASAYDEDGNTFAGMGIDFADYDNDGWPDIFINALAQQKYALFHNRAGSFDYVSGPPGMAASQCQSFGMGRRIRRLR